MSKNNGADVKAVLGTDGKTDNYFGGSGKADGPGHGHVAVKSDGSVSLVRDQARGGETRGEVLVDDRKK